MEQKGILADIAAELEAHPHWQLLQRMIASPQFARSARLKTFLQYVTRCALLDHPEQVTEQQIGVYVFGKPADYNASEDNIVRSQARFLRIKLGEYFESPAGREEPIVLTIPKGTYLPHFAPRAHASYGPAEPVSAAAPATVSAMEAPAEPGGWRRYRIPVLAVLGLLAIAVLIWQRASGPARANDSSLWPRLFEPGQSTTIVASDYIFSMVQEAADRTLTLDDYLRADYYSRIAQLSEASGLERLFPNIAQRHYTGFENVTGIARLMNVKESHLTHTLVRFARDMTMRDIGSGNLILVGSKQSNPWVQLFEAKLTFQFEYQNAGHMVFIRNRSPQAGEEAAYHPSSLDEQSRVIYGGIAFLPNLNRGGNVLIIQGTSMGGSEIGLEVLDNPALFRDLLRRVAAARRAGEIPYFEALIRTRTMNGVAGESTIVASRVLGE
uniref:Uncharacterized protein n=1 Tax=Solibacter usitatus (strain Ellin6076) TaxID=234267 RepID=Q027J0_SOLUE